MQRHALSENTNRRSMSTLLAFIAVAVGLLAAGPRPVLGQLPPTEPAPQTISGAGMDIPFSFVAPAPAAGSNTTGTPFSGSVSPEDVQPEPLPSLIKTQINLDKAERYLTDVKDGEYGVIEGGSLWLLKEASELEISRFDPDPPDKEVPFSNMLEAPALYRGKPVTVSGRVGSVAEFDVDMEQLPSVKKLWKIEIYKPTRAQHAWVCTLLVSEDPGPLKVKETDVRMKGYFYKLRSYEFEEPDDPEENVWIQKCPIVVGRYVQVVGRTAPVAPAAKGKQDSNSSAAGLLLAAIVASILFLVLLLLFVRKFIATRQEYAVRPTRELTEQEVAERRRFLEQAGSDTPADEGRSG